MRKLVHIVVMLWLTVLGGAGAAVWSGHQRMLTAAQMFTLPDGSPCSDCLFGIVPGTSTFEESERLLRAHPLTARMVKLEATNALVQSYAAYDLVITLHRRKDGVITDVMLFFAKNDPALPTTALSTLRLADMWSILAQPSNVSIGTDPLRAASYSRNYATWRYDAQHLLVVARLRSGRMSQAALIAHIHLTSEFSTLGIYSPLHFSSRVTLSYDSDRWHGFALAMRYMRDAIYRADARQTLN